MDAHFNEYLAAATGIAEQTPAPRQTHDLAVGDFVSGVSGGKRWSGNVEWIADDGRVCIKLDGGWVYVSTADITH